jgi:23S rRNA (cytosine1962-C5)-methyltransferase
MRFLCEPVHGQKTGFFLDQREHRRLVRLIAPERTVLNLFGYTGGFSIAAGLGGADSVTTVDIARPAIAAAEKNWLLNGLPATKHRGVVSDAMRFLDEARQSSEQYSLVIVDPPSFIHSKAGFDSGYRAYHALFSNALNLVSKQGLIAFASCSSHLSTESFRALVEESLSSAKRRGLILQLSGQPADHPFPAICQELQYLKFCLLKIEN